MLYSTAIPVNKPFLAMRAEKVPRSPIRPAFRTTISSILTRLERWSAILEDGATRLKLIDGFLNFCFRVGVRGGCRLVEDYKGSFLVKGAGRGIEPKQSASNSQGV